MSKISSGGALNCLGKWLSSYSLLTEHCRSPTLALSRLHQTLTKLSSRDGRSGNSASASGRYDDDDDGNDGWMSRITNGAKRFFSAAKDVIGGGGTRN